MTYINPDIQIIEGEAVGTCMRLNEFLAVNEIPLDSEEADDIRAALISPTDVAVYTGGGGAAPIWSIAYARSTMKPLRLASAYPQSDCPDLDDCRICQDPNHDSPCCLTHCATCKAVCEQPEE